MKYPGNESSKLEFKEKLPKNDQILKTILAFCNTVGGKLIIGVQDDGTIVGLAEKKVQSVLEWLDKMIYESCTPPIIPLIYQQRIDNRILLVIEVSPGMNKPYYKTASGLTNGVFVRLGRSTMKANADIIEELKWQSRGISYDSLPVYSATYEKVSIAKIEDFLARRRNGQKSIVTKEILSSYHLITEEHGQTYPSVAGILLFSEHTQKYFPEIYILCSHFSGFKGRDAIASRHCTGTLFEQFDAAFDFMIDRINKSFKITDKQREESYSIPPTAIREALMNSILHRNYHINAPIKIAIYNNRIEIFSPGNFAGPIDTTQLETGITYIRNTTIAKIMWECRYVEKMGSGFIEIFDSYRKAGLVMPEIIEGTNFIKCILPTLKADKGVIDNAKRILNLLKIEPDISRSDIVSRLNIPRATLGRILLKLIEEGKLTRSGKGRSVKYRLSKS